jgi:uncharacterized damage-inducible protein DinB
MSASGSAQQPEGTRDEAESLQAVLDRTRRDFAWKTAGLDDTGLRATTAASSITLGGLLKHMAWVEADWLAVKLAGGEYGAPWDTVGLGADPAWAWRTAAADPHAELYGLWRDAVSRSRRIVPEIIQARGLAGQASFTQPDGRTPSVRDMLLHMIEEYARHTGHADVVREAVDGRVGDAAPADYVF